MSTEQRQAVATARNILPAAAKKVEAERVHTKRAVTRAKNNLGRQAQANDAVAALPVQIAYGKIEKVTMARESGEPHVVQASLNAAAKEMRRLPEGVQPVTPKHFVDHHTSTMARDPTQKDMTKCINAADIDPEEIHVHLSNLTSGVKTDQHRDECFDG